MNMRCLVFTLLISFVAILSARGQTGVSPTEARAIAKEAYIYGYHMVDSYRIQHAYFVDRQNPEFKAPWNQIRNIPRVFTPEDKAVQTPNSDTPYSMLGLDLRAEPIVLTVPPIEKDRYFSVQLEAKEVTSGDIFGTRGYLKNNYLYRMAAAALGIYGNSKIEAMYPISALDSDGHKLDGANRYTLRFASDQLPPVNAFWSLTMYELPSSLLVANPLNRYLLNSPMLPEFKRDTDGGITFYIQNESPGADKEADWLPAPKGPFFIAMRLYWPKPAALDGSWKQPPMRRVQ
jgi:hypothetical protein